MKDYYYILGIPPSASAEEIKKAYKKLSQKFHPDKNDGDAFFAERFKEILEAYDALKEPMARQCYDRNREHHFSGNNHSQGNNFLPEIEFFRADKNAVEYGEEVTFSWKVLNADRVEIEPFGAVPPIGSKTYRLKNFKNPALSFLITAHNTFIGRESRKTLTLRNRTYEEQRRHFSEKLAADTPNNDEAEAGNTKESPLIKYAAIAVVFIIVTWTIYILLSNRSDL